MINSFIPNSRLSIFVRKATKVDFYFFAKCVTVSNCSGLEIKINIKKEKRCLKKFRMRYMLGVKG